jgi:hypothetical protein
VISPRSIFTNTAREGDGSLASVIVATARTVRRPMSSMIWPNPIYSPAPRPCRPSWGLLQSPARLLNSLGSFEAQRTRMRSGEEIKSSSGIVPGPSWTQARCSTPISGLCVARDGWAFRRCRDMGTCSDYSMPLVRHCHQVVWCRA